MSKVVGELSMSLDGFVAGPDDSPDKPLGDGGEALFKWYHSGDTDFPLPGTDMVFKISRAGADLLQEEWHKIGAMVAGRRMFDIANAWHGSPPGGGLCFIVTHNPPLEWVKKGSPFTFVTDGVASAVRQAKQAAGDKNVSAAGASIIQQAIRAGLLDEIQIDLVAVLLGSGVRLFDNLGDIPIDLEIIRVVATPDVTHINFRIAK